jgi:hypothetical protein
MSRRKPERDADGDAQPEAEAPAPTAADNQYQARAPHVHVTPTPIRWRAIVLHYKNWHVKEIVEALGVSQSTVYALIKQFEETGDGT